MPVEFSIPVYVHYPISGWRVEESYKLLAGQQGLVAACDTKRTAILSPYLALRVPPEDDNHVLVANLSQLTPIQANRLIQAVHAGEWPIEALPYVQGEHQIGQVIFQYKPSRVRSIKLPFSPTPSSV